MAAAHAPQAQQQVHLQHQKQDGAGGVEQQGEGAAARLTFPQIWVESVCESSEDEDGDVGKRDNFNSLKNAAISSSSSSSTRPKDKVLRSLLLASSADVSFESSGSGSNVSSKQNSFREDSVDLDGAAASPSVTAAIPCFVQAAAVADGESESEDRGRSVKEESQPDAATGDNQDVCHEPPVVVADVSSSVSEAIEAWLARVQARGFPPDVLADFARDDFDADEEDDIWFCQGLVRVFDPYYDLEADDVASVEDGPGRLDPATGLPNGRCTVRLNNGDELLGNFRRGLRQGRGSVEGANFLAHGLVTVRGSYKDGVLMGPGLAVLAEDASWARVKGRVTLEGVFNDGYLEGPVRGLDESGALTFVGRYEKGLPVGTCWLAREGQGWLCGQVDNAGRFTGDGVAFVYPDLTTVLAGRFEGEVMLRASEARVVAAVLDEAHVMVLKLEEANRGEEFRYRPSDASGVHCDWTLADPYESATVRCDPSLVCGAGDGLFARADLPTDRVVSFYNGVRVRPGERYDPSATGTDGPRYDESGAFAAPSSTSSAEYQIYVDWSDTDRSPFVDVPRECADVSQYCASLAHKANHSFRPNCRFVSVDHPTFGRIPALKTIVSVAAGQELFSHYKYDMALAPSWYQQAWERTQRSRSASPPSTTASQKSASPPPPPALLLRRLAASQDPTFSESQNIECFLPPAACSHSNFISLQFNATSVSPRISCHRCGVLIIYHLFL